MDVRKLAEKYEEYVISTRRWLHQRPEVAWDEFETTEFIAQELKKMGLEPQGFGDKRTGLYCMIYGGKAKPNAKTIMLRADIDALPMEEQTNLPYASRYENRMHACGHDCHTAMLLGAVKILTELKDGLPGNIKLLFQAAEETSIGAKWYVDQGVMDGVNAVYGCHIASWIDAPYIMVDAGPRTAACDEFIITVDGVSCHGGMPSHGKDAIVAASAVVMNLQSIVSRRTDSVDSLVITTGKMNGGHNYNVVCGQVVLNGTVRSYSKEVRKGVPALMEEVAMNTARAFGCSAKVEYLHGTPAIINDDEQMNSIAKDAVLKLYGSEVLGTSRPVGMGDDFAYFREKCPGIFAFIGGGNKELGYTYAHHHPKFNVDESSLSRGTAMYAQMAIDFLAGCE